MESGIQSSFIPKDAGKSTAAPRLERGGGLGDLLLLISIVLFVASGALAGAVFLYKQYLESSVLTKVQQLKKSREAFDPVLIQTVTRLDDRMHGADVLITGHLAPIVLFQALQQATLSTVAFDTLDYEAGDPKHIAIKMTGVAKSVNSIALQADILSKNGLVTSPIFSGISRQIDGVHFSLSAFVNPAAIGYIGFVNGTGGAPAPVTQQAAPTQTTPFGNSSDPNGTATQPTQPTQPVQPTQTTQSTQPVPSTQPARVTQPASTQTTAPAVKPVPKSSPSPAATPLD